MGAVHVHAGFHTVCLSVCVCPFWAITFECHDVQKFLVWWYILTISKSRSLGQGQDHFCKIDYSVGYQILLL